MLFFYCNIYFANGQKVSLFLENVDLNYARVFGTESDSGMVGGIRMLFEYTVLLLGHFSCQPYKGHAEDQE